jgi:outer membrane immunogenic protein
MRIALSIVCLLTATSVATANSGSGFHAGVFASYGSSGDATLLSGLTPTIQTNWIDTGDVASEVPMDGTNFGGGVRGGYDWPLGGSLFVGVEASVAYLGIDEQSSRPGPTDASRIVTATVQQDYLATAMARAGFVASSTIRLQLSGGFAFGDTDMTTALTRTPSCTGNNCQQGSTSDTATGWALGAGAEYALSPTMALRLDYLHYDLGTQSHQMTDPAFPATVFVAESDFSGDLVQIGVDWSF